MYSVSELLNQTVEPSVADEMIWQAIHPDHQQAIIRVLKPYVESAVRDMFREELADEIFDLIRVWRDE